MITLTNVTDTPVIEDEPRPLAINTTLQIPHGRYVLLAQNLRLRKPAIDLLAGLRPPMSGLITRVGAGSWPIGRSTMMRGYLTGHQMIDLVARVYLLDTEMCHWIAEQMLTDPDRLSESVKNWPVTLRIEFGHLISLLPPFDIYFVDGSLPFRKDRFTELWRPLFSRRIEGRTLIISAIRASDALEFCDAALVLRHGQLHIEREFEQLLDEFPVRAVPVDGVDSAGAVGDAITVDNDFWS